ncbi:MAG: hypothetical protein ABI388_00870 [Bacteroidia bacterium]
MPQEFSIQPYLQDAEIIHQTAEQIKKDFAFFEINIVFKNNSQNAYDTLYQEIFPQIKKLLESNSQKIFSLLYRIDISETQLKNESQKNSEQTSEEIITHLIIKRCLQKVVLRKLYSPK